MDHRFRAESHIRRRAEFQRVYEAATRKLGGAVVRNRVKRLVREVFRQHANPPGLDIVVVPRPTLLDASFAAIESDYASCVDRRTRRSHPAS